MALSWYEKMSGSGRSGQVVSSEQLLTELKRLDFRFRQRGSHITFHHDEKGVRGTIVYGTRKLWSQKTVANILRSLRGEETNEPQAQAPVQSVQKTFSSRSAPRINTPSHLKVDIYDNDPTQLVLRDRTYPQVGSMVSTYDHPDVVRKVVDDIAAAKRIFESSLSCLTSDGDFHVAQEDGVLAVSHPVLGIYAALDPYDPAETQDPSKILDQCFDGLSPFEDNRTILNAVIASRKLELLNEMPQDDGSVLRTYVSRKFQRHFGTRVALKTTQTGYVMDEHLMGFIDDVDAMFFDGVKEFMKNTYGFEVKGTSRDENLHADHPMLKELGFYFPNFARLPKLRSIYAQREELGEEAYINAINDILERRDDILELVSTGLILSVEQMTTSSQKLFDIIDELKRLMDATTEAVSERGDAPIPEPTDESKEQIESVKTTLKRMDKKNKRMTSTRVKHSFDRTASASHAPLSSIRDQKLPEAFPYGRIRNIAMKDPFTNAHTGDAQYMILRGPDGSYLMLMSEHGLNIFNGFLDRGRAVAARADIDPSSVPSDPKLVQMREDMLAGMNRLTPSIPGG